MSEQLLDTIKSRGYWHGIIRPVRFEAERIPGLKECGEIIENSQVRHRGWYFPHYNPRDMYRGIDYVGLATSFMHHKEAWRFYQSGQFTYFRGLSEDWTEEAKPLVSTTIEPGTGLDVLSVLYHVSEIYEFTVRLGKAEMFDEQVFLRIDLAGLEGRELFFWSESRLLRQQYICRAPRLTRERILNVTDLLARSKEYSLEYFFWIMECFGFDASKSVFGRDQEKFFEGRY